MTNTDIFDVLVVYTSHIAISASAANADIQTPFPITYEKAVLNEVYKYFIEQCARQNISAVFTTTSDVTGAGKAKSYWNLEEGVWCKVRRSCYAQNIFDKFSPSESIQRDILFSSIAIKPFSNTNLFTLFSDKLSTYRSFMNYSIPTVEVMDTSILSAQYAIEELREIIELHPNKQDFGNSIVMKDKFGSGGKNVNKIESDFVKTISKIAQRNGKTQYVLQPYVNFNNGFIYQNYRGNTEIRLIYMGQTIVQSYIRVAQNNTFLCNEGIGGISILQKDIPKTVLKASNKLARTLNKKHALYALDFIVSNNKNVYLLEGNINPGIDWYPEFPENVKMNKKMIVTIAQELARRIQIPHSPEQLTNISYIPVSGLSHPIKHQKIKHVTT